MSNSEIPVERQGRRKEFREDFPKAAHIEIHCISANMN